MNEALQAAIENTDSYSGGHYDQINTASKVLTKLAWDEYPAQSFTNLVTAIEALSPRLAKVLEKEGITYTVLFNDSTCASGYYQEGIQVDTEEWYADAPELRDIFNLLDDANLGDQVWNAIRTFEDEIAAEVQTLMQGFGESDLSALLEAESSEGE